MRAHVDFEKKTIRASVGDLVEPPREGMRSLGVLAKLRAELGKDVHKRYRQEREANQAGFSAEIGVELTCSVDDYQATVHGRLDGLIDDGKGLLIEEVKSVTLTASQLNAVESDDFPDYASQARLYALCLAAKHPDKTVEARLILESVIDGSRRALPVPFNRSSTMRKLTALFRSAIKEAEDARERARVTADAAKRLRFPYEALRPHQQELLELIAGGLERGRPVLAMAPTGIGKTVCALLEGMRYALARGAVLFFLTAKTTQQELVRSTFEDVLRASGLPVETLSALTLRAKERMCPPGDLLCHPELCPFLAEFDQRAEKSGAVDALIEEKRHIEPDVVYRCGEEHRLCPFELSLRVAARVDLVICDYNYVYDPSVALGLFEEPSGGREAVVVVDEAHNLFDRAREYFSPFIGKKALTDVRKRLGSGECLAPREDTSEQLFEDLLPAIKGPLLFREMDELCERLGAYIDEGLKSALEEGRPFAEDATPVGYDSKAWESFADEAGRLMVQYAIYNRLHQIVRPRDPIMDLLRDVSRMHDTIKRGEPECVPYIAGEKCPWDAGAGVLCVNPAKRLAERHERVAGTVAMSATLTPLFYFRDVLGFKELEPVASSLPSPFPPENRCVAIVPSVRTTFRARDRHYGDIARLIEGVVSVKPGRYVAYFPSFAFLKRVRELLAVPEDQVLVQTSSMSQYARSRTMAAFLERSPCLLLAVMGGIFAEGVDLPGEALIGAIVVGPGLPPVGFERELMRRYYDEHHEAGFAYAMLYPGMQRVIQSAGRVIRTMDDRGVIVLLGARFADQAYADCLPEDWYERGSWELIHEDPGARLHEFWES